MKAAELYAAISPSFARHAASAVDEQTDLAERLSLVDAVIGDKPMFVAFLRREGRRQLFEEISRLPLSGVASGFAAVDVHHNYRPLKLAGCPTEVAELVARRGRRLDLFWATTEPTLAQAVRTDTLASLSDVQTLGYPSCCAEWHYDVYFARGIEAFSAVAAAQGMEEAWSFLRRDWVPESGFFLPEPAFIAGLLRSNWRHPFIDHVSCPTCVADHGSPSAEMNRRRSSLAKEFDPDLARLVLRWAGRQDQAWWAMAIEAGQVRRFAEALDLNVRATDIYARHARHLLKAMAL